MFAVATCSPTLNVTSFLVMPTNSLGVPSPSLGEYLYNKLYMALFTSKISRLFLHHFNRFNFLPAGIVDIAFQSAELANMPHPPGISTSTLHRQR